MSTFQCDVLVVGGGPGGSTVDASLAERGGDVVAMDKAHHPRLHIDESLLPADVDRFRRLGVLEEVERIGSARWGIEFVSPERGRAASIEFADARDETRARAWQVRRSELDELLARNDPVVSSGVFPAMQVGFEVVAAIEPRLDRPETASAARRTSGREMRFGSQQFSWFIVRVAHPTLRDVSMAPSNPLRVEEAPMSLRVGDSVGGTPAGRGVRTRKLLDRAVSPAHLRRSWRAWQRRRANIRPAVDGTVA